MGDLKWYEKPVRMMRLDYLGEMDRMRNADLDALAKSKRDEWGINCEWVIGTLGAAPGLGYQTAFNSPSFEKYPLLGDFDLLREYLPHARKYGLHVLAYLNMHWFAFDWADKHPGWEQVTSDGVAYGRRNPLYGNGTTLCVNSGWRDWATGLIAEAMKTGIDGVFLDGPLFYPGCCYCDDCRDKFASLYGADIPLVEDWSDPMWARFVEFRAKSLAGFMADSRAAAKSVNPDGVAFLNAGTWHANTWRFARSLDTIGDFEDFNGAEEFFHPGSPGKSVLGWAATAKYMVAGGKPAVVFSHHTLGAWHYIPLPKLETQLAIAQTVACGANPWFAVFDYALDHSRDAAVDAVKDINGFLASHEDYYTQTESAADVALLNSSQTSTYYVSTYPEFYGALGSGREENLGVDAGGGGGSVQDWKKRKEICEGIVDQSYLGYFQALSRAHVPFDVVLDKQISPEGLSRYRVLILPNAACLSDAQVEAIQEFARRGGSVIAEFETGAYDELGRPRSANPLLETLGISSTGEMMRPAAAEEYVRVKQHATTEGFRPEQLIPRPPFSLRCEPATGVSVPAIFMNEVGGSYKKLEGESANPAIVAHTAGVSRTIYLPSLVGEAYGRFRLADHQKLIENLVRWAHADPFVVSVDAPSTVEVEPRWSQSKDQLLIHLVNNTGDMQRPISEIIPIRDVRIHLRMENVKTARALRADTDLPLTPAADGVEFTLPELGVYELVVVELI